VEKFFRVGQSTDDSTTRCRNDGTCVPDNKSKNRHTFIIFSNYYFEHEFEIFYCSTTICFCIPMATPNTSLLSTATSIRVPTHKAHVLLPLHDNNGYAHSTCSVLLYLHVKVFLNYFLPGPFSGQFFLELHKIHDVVK